MNHDQELAHFHSLKDRVAAAVEAEFGADIVFTADVANVLIRIAGQILVSTLLQFDDAAAQAEWNAFQQNVVRNYVERRDAQTMN